MTRLLVLLLATSASLPLLASPFDRFPAADVPVSDPRFVGADGQQHNASLAMGAGMFLAVWSHPGQRVYAARISGSGELLDPHPIPIASDATQARVVWARDRFAVISTSLEGPWWASISAGGEVIARRRIGLPPSMPAAACSSSTCLIAWTDWTGEPGVFAARVDGDGNLLESRRKIAPLGPVGARVTVATNGNDFLVGWQQEGTLYVSAVPPVGAATAPQAIGTTRTVSIASEGSRYLIAGETFAQRIAGDGTLVGQRIAPPGPGFATVVHSNDAYLLMRTNGPSIEGVRIDEDGVLLDATPRLLAALPKEALGVIAPHEHDPFFVLWASRKGNDLYAARLDAFGGSTHLLITRSAPGQRNLQLSTDGRSLLAAWNETADDESKIGVAAIAADGTRTGSWIVNDARNAKGTPVAASNGHESLIVWLESDTPYSRERVVASLVGPEGPPENVIEITAAACFSGAVAVASDGEDFLVSWHDCGAAANQMYAARVVDGMALPPFSLAAPGLTQIQTAPALQWTYVGDIAFTGEHYVVTWIEGRHVPGCFHGCSRNTLRAMRVSTEGQLLDSEPVAVLSDEPAGSIPAPRAVWDGKQVVIAWRSDRGIEAADLDGAVSRNRRQLLRSSHPFDIAASDTGLAIVWQQRGTSGNALYAARAGTGTVEPDDAVLVARLGDDDALPSAIVPDGRSLIVGYQRPAFEAVYSGASRVFLRGVAASGGHRRAVRR
jgi:hypothetical protein